MYSSLWDSSVESGNSATPSASEEPAISPRIAPHRSLAHFFFLLLTFIAYLHAVLPPDPKHHHQIKGQAKKDRIEGIIVIAILSKAPTTMTTRSNT